MTAENAEERITQAAEEISEVLDRYDLLMLVDIFSGGYFLIPAEDQREHNRQLH